MAAPHYTCAQLNSLVLCVMLLLLLPLRLLPHREDALLLLQRPLAQQVELLHLWHAALSTYLATFLQQFKEAGGRVMLAAGRTGALLAAVRARLKAAMPLCGGGTLKTCSETAKCSQLVRCTVRVQGVPCTVLPLAAGVMLALPHVARCLATCLLQTRTPSALQWRGSRTRDLCGCRYASVPVAACMVLYGMLAVLNSTYCFVLCIDSLHMPWRVG